MRVYQLLLKCNQMSPNIYRTARKCKTLQYDEFNITALYRQSDILNFRLIVIDRVVIDRLSYHKSSFNQVVFTC